MSKIESLLKWCEFHTSGYQHVSINNFTASWKNGMAFNALIHRFKPELIDFHQLNPDNEYYNNYIAFKTAEVQFGIPSILDPYDMGLAAGPEMLSIITYVSQFYNCLKDMEPMGGPSVNMFGNGNDDNNDLERSMLTSINRLTNMKCSICRTKVYLLERYVAVDKLYHRMCYRYFQLNNMDKDSEVIRDNLNICGELKPSMNSKIFVHPFQGIIVDKSNYSVITNPLDNMDKDSELLEDNPNICGELQSNIDSTTFDHSVNADNTRDAPTSTHIEHIMVEIYTDSDESEEYEDALESPYSSGSSGFELCRTDGVREEESEIKIASSRINDDLRDFQDRIDSSINYIGEEISIQMYGTQKKEDFHRDSIDPIIDPTCIENESETRMDNPEIKKDLRISEDIILPNVAFETSPKHVKGKLYFKKKDKELPYSTSFEITTDQNSIDSLSTLGYHPSKVNHKHSLPKETDEFFAISADYSGKSNIVNLERELLDTGRNTKKKTSTISLTVNKTIPDFSWYNEYKDRLSILNTKQSALESKGRIIQKQLWDEDPTSENYEDLLNTWLDLVDEKDKIFYEESSLLTWLSEMKRQETSEELMKLQCSNPSINQIEERHGSDYPRIRGDTNEEESHERVSMRHSTNSTRDGKQRFAMAVQND